MKDIFLMRSRFIVVLGLVSSLWADEPQKIVSITQNISHPALNAVREGIKGVVSRSYPDIRYIEGDAQGTISLATQLAQAHGAQSPQVMVAISTPSAQSAVKVSRGRIPVVFTAITDPKSAKLIPETGVSPMVTGVTDLPPFERQIDFIMTLVPGLKTLGILYNPGEDNSVTSLKILESLLKAKDLILMPLPVGKAADVKQSLLMAVDKVQAVYVPNDNTVVSAIETVAKVSLTHKLPLFAADILLVEKGCVAMVGVDYEQIGRQTGDMVVKILGGMSVANLPVENPKDYKIYLNQTLADKLGIRFEDALVKKADRVF